VTAHGDNAAHDAAIAVTALNPLDLRNRVTIVQLRDGTPTRETLQLPPDDSAVGLYRSLNIMAFGSSAEPYGANEAQAVSREGLWRIRLAGRSRERASLVVPAIIALLAHPNAEVRRGASDTLVEYGETCIPWVVAALNPEHRTVFFARSRLVGTTEEAWRANAQQSGERASFYLRRILIGIGDPAVPWLTPLLAEPGMEAVARSILDAIQDR